MNAGRPTTCNLNRRPPRERRTGTTPPQHDQQRGQAHGTHRQCAATASSGGFDSGGSPLRNAASSSADPRRPRRPRPMPIRRLEHPELHAPVVKRICKPLPKSVALSAATTWPQRPHRVVLLASTRAITSPSACASRSNPACATRRSRPAAPSSPARRTPAPPPADPAHPAPAAPASRRTGTDCANRRSPSRPPRHAPSPGPRSGQSPTPRSVARPEYEACSRAARLNSGTPRSQSSLKPASADSTSVRHAALLRVAIQPRRELRIHRRSTRLRHHALPVVVPASVRTAGDVRTVGDENVAGGRSLNPRPRDGTHQGVPGGVHLALERRPPPVRFPVHERRSTPLVWLCACV
jgi:hypothetical protein